MLRLGVSGSASRLPLGCVVPASPGGMGAPCLMGVAVPGTLRRHTKGHAGSELSPRCSGGEGRGGFLFCTEAAANKVGGFSWKPWPRRARSSPVAIGDGSRRLGGRRGVLQSSPPPCPSPVTKPLPGAACTCRGLGVPTSPYTHPLAKTLPALGCQGAAGQGWGRVSPVLQAVSGSGCVGHLQHPLQHMGGSRQDASHPPCQLSVRGVFPGKAKPMSHFGAGNIRVSGEGDAWSGMGWGAPCLGLRSGEPYGKKPPCPRLAWHHLMLRGLAPARPLPWAS